MVSGFEVVTGIVSEDPVSIIGFVWRPEEATPQVVRTARMTGSRAIFDFSMRSVEELRTSLLKTVSSGCARDIRISFPALMDPSLGRSLKGTGVREIWVECNPRLFQADTSVLLGRLKDLSADFRCFPIIGDLDLLTEILKDSSGVGRIALKGCEASGFVSGETAFSLYSIAKKMLRADSKSPDLLIWGGISTPEAAAAFLTTGAKGIVFESVHWLTDMVAIDDAQRGRISKLRLDSTDLVGLDLQVSCRLFNKGNSLAFREIRKFEDTLCGKEITEESRRAFANSIQSGAVHPLTGRFSNDEVIPLGVEAAFAQSFVERYGTETTEALKTFVEEIRKTCRLAGTRRNCYIDNPVAGEMGTRYPFIQGAMSWITDVPEFAARVADAGGLPTIALGLMDAETLDRRLGNLPEIMGGRPYAVNVVTLAENPYRETHLAWIKKQRPGFVVIAGGDLSALKELKECSIEVIYIAPDEALLRLALEAGVRYVVCEGYEAGGHVGRHSTLTLAQMVLEMKRRTPSLFKNCRVVLAGGIFNRETAFMAAMLGADAIQMGTAYLAAGDIVETGALTALYQRMILKSPPGAAVVTGKDTGLRVRSLRTPKVEAILSLEREFAAGREDEPAFRAKMEEMAAGSLFAAARGMDRPGETPLDERACIERGQFMSGSCAGLIGEVLALKSFHAELAEGPFDLHQPVFAVAEETPGTKASEVSGGIRRSAPTRGYPGGDCRAIYDQERVAITGMSILNALGNTPEEVWTASLAMKSGITLVPPSRWDHGLFYDPRPQIPDKTYCKVGAFLDFNVSRHELGIPPHDFRSMTDATKLTLWLADRAIRASGILESDIPRERIGVFVSQNSGEAAGALNNTIIRAYVHDILAAVKRAVPLTPEQQSAIEREVKSGRIAPDDTTLLGRLNSAAAGFICNRYGFMGPSYAVSAACATSLVALYSAIQMVRTGILDAAIVGGGEETLTHLHFLEFSALGALYGLSEKERPAQEASRPFDAERGGMVLGEGGGMIVIEREDLARKRGACLHAVITGMGASNNNLGMVESSSVSQQMAIRASFDGTPYGPDAVDLVECHATSTRQGDVEEVRALKAVFDPSRRTVLTAFKSQIGHTLGASGLNSLIRGVTAMKAGIFPPTLNYQHPDPEISLDGSGLFIAREPLDWNRGSGQPRRLQVNAFGFGGSNYVVQVEQAMDDRDTVMALQGGHPVRDVEMSGGPSAIDATMQGVSFFRTELEDKNCRIAVVAPSKEEALMVIGRSAYLTEAGIDSPGVVRSLAQQGIFIGREEMPARPLAFVFPGQGSQYPGMGRDLYESFPVIREWMDRAAAAADFDLLNLLFHDREENLQKTRWQQPAMFAIEHAMARYLTALGIRPVAMAGHSLGELTALCMAGVYSPEDGFRIVNKRALCMDKAAAMNVEPGVMAAVDVPLDPLKEMIRGLGNVHIGNINSPNQIVLSGSTGAVKDLGKKIKAMGYRATMLPVSMAFHSPIMRVIHDELAAYISGITFHPPQIPVISNTTMEPYPSDPVEIRRILMSHLESTVHWMDNVRTLRNDYGVRHFVEVGPGDILSSLITDTLTDSVCIQTCIPSSEGPTYRTALARLFSGGHLKVEEGPTFVSLSSSNKAPASDRNTAVEQASPASAGTSARQDHIEALIQIIMEATGFNRDEIEPDMDLRRDLSIRSSRLPIIMDAAERHFGITIEFEDFIEVRTVRDIARKISDIVGAKEGASQTPSADATASVLVHDEALKPLQTEAGLKRLIFRNVPVDLSASAPITLTRGDTVLFLSPETDDGIAKDAADVFHKDYGIDTISMQYMREVMSKAPSPLLSEQIAELSNLSGMVITLPKGLSEEIKEMADVSRLLRGLFLSLKAFLKSPSKKFVFMIHGGEGADSPGVLLSEGMLGLFLSAAQEYPSVQFRTLEINGGIGSSPELRLALRNALDRGYCVVEMIHREGRVLTSEGQLAPSVFGASPGLALSAGDVIVMSGGATGISAHLARCLAPFNPRLVFLGRTSLDSCNARTSEIAHTLTDLTSAGIEATYYTCDVTDPDAVRAIMGEVTGRYGRIDGIIHGAGVLRDGFLSRMTQEDFSMVTDVKFLGAWNLFSAAENTGLRFFIGLSSAAAIQGNPGQANYAAANRMMSGLLRDLRRKNKAIVFKALMLPPVEGAGMAEDPEVRALLKQKGVGYIHVNELAGLFCRELFTAPADDVWVMFMRRLPSVRTALITDTDNHINDAGLIGALNGGTLSLRPGDFPMIESIVSMDMRREQLEVERSFSVDKDLWIADHRPFRFVKHPLVSACMVLETFMEAARMLYPHLRVRGVRHVRLMDMIQCPPGVTRATRISCRNAGIGLPEVLCEVSLSAQEISPSGRLTDRFITHYSGQVMLGGAAMAEGYTGDGLTDFPVRKEELLTGPMDHKKVLKWYKDRSGLEDRYRVIESIEGAGPAAVRGRTIYRETRDFSDLRNAVYQYSPYLFEALLQLAGFTVALTDPSERRSLIPVEIAEMRFSRKCRAGEVITLEARMRAKDDEGLTWDARGTDDQGSTIMQIQGIRMHWVSD
ncbi:MAG: SDR family NAD(P)-dependent oxidoreductase [Nitrospirae bacterium]|nr:SDR family NAD(P)-dependent oxidoreductase [Nitrospirota bacterium]